MPEYSEELSESEPSPSVVSPPLSLSSGSLESCSAAGGGVGVVGGASAGGGRGSEEEEELEEGLLAFPLYPFLPYWKSSVE